MLIRMLDPLASSSRMRSKISTLESTAIATDNTTPAMPGSVRVASIRAIDDNSNSRLNARHRSAMTPAFR